MEQAWQQDYVEPFPNDVLLQLIPSFLRVSHSKGVSRQVRSLEYSAALGAEAGHGLTSDQSTSAVAERPACFHGKLIMEDFDDNLDL